MSFGNDVKVTGSWIRIRGLLSFCALALWGSVNSLDLKLLVISGEVRRTLTP